MEEKKTARIRLLTDQTINQIAAGEVIENSASVVKELIENSVDAGSSHITLETTGAGRAFLAIRDNGCGMGEEDLLLSIERHATSKISSADDLYKLSTLGFRGEALASIASISKMKIHSSLEDGSGKVLYCEGGKILSCTDLPRRRGTSIEVSALFYNVPARKKFQKSLSSERSEIHKVLTHAALCYPEITFEWVDEGKQEFALIANLPRVKSLLGEEFVRHTLEVKAEKEGFTLHGNLVHSSLHRPNRVGQYLFVNRRAVMSPFISSVVEESYGTRLPSHRFPLFVLHLACPAETIDVNIHPRKKEIRFHDEKVLREVVQHACRLALEEKAKPAHTISQHKVSLPAAFSLSHFEAHVETREDRPRSGKFLYLFSLGKFLFFREEEEIIAVDSQRARARLFFDKMEKGIEIGVQNLLFPLHIEKSGAEFKKLEGALPLLNELGIVIRPFGRNSFAVDAFPAIFEQEEILNTIDALLDDETLLTRGVNKKKAFLIFCKKIRKKEFNPHEANLLIEELFASSESSLCPEGKKIWIKITEEELAKWF